MLLEFSLGNYRSFNTVQTLDFRSTALVSDDKSIDQNNIVEKDGERILKTVGIYGPNGSGKSNLLRGLRIFTQLVVASLENEAIMSFAPDPFQLTEVKSDNAGFFQIQLLLEGKKYRYGFTLSSEGIVLQEWLFGPAEKNETWYFKRTLTKIESNKEWFEEGYNLPIDNLRVDTLYLTFVSAYNGSISQTIRNFINKKIYFDTSSRSIRRSVTGGRSVAVRGGSSGNHLTDQLIKDGDSNLVLEWLKTAGLVYSGIDLVEYDKFTTTVLLKKNILDKTGKITGQAELDLQENESDGTRKYYNYIGKLYKKFTEGGIIIVDEIDNNFHPSLLQQLIRSFNNSSINIEAAQLLFTSHDTNLLQPDILRRDQIYLTEKSSADETVLFCLGDLKGIRNNADFARQYLAGFYGALPMLEKFKLD